MLKSAGFPCQNISASVRWDICREQVLPEVFFSFNDKLDELCVACESKISPDTEEKIIALIDSITKELILPKRERMVI